MLFDMPQYSPRLYVSFVECDRFVHALCGIAMNKLSAVKRFQRRYMGGIHVQDNCWSELQAAEVRSEHSRELVYERRWRPSNVPYSF